MIIPTVKETFNFKVDTVEDEKLNSAVHGNHSINNYIQTTAILAIKFV